jgi:IclR family transcriptional regulator, pca regulon regulatory protein
VLLTGLPDAELDRVLDASDIRAYIDKSQTDRKALKKTLVGVSASRYASVVEELEPGLQSVAVPIMDRSHRVIGAMNISCHASRYSEEKMLEIFLPPLQHAADQINQALQRR